MNDHKLRSISIASAILLACLSVPARAQADIEQFSDFLAQFRTDNSIPALSAAIVRGGRIVWAEAFGFSDDEAEVPADTDTTFYIASVTKPIAATAILIEAEQNGLDLDTPLSADPGFDGFCEWLRSSQIIFGKGGIEDAGYDIGPINCETRLTVRNALDMRVNEGSENGFAYNPLVYARIGRAIEGSGGRPLREIVRSNVLARADMHDVALGWRDPQGGAALRNLAQPFRVRDGDLEKAALPDDDFRAAAGIYASPTQIARFDIAFDEHLLPDEWRDRITDLPAERGYGLGWWHEEWEGKKLIWHGGWQPDAYSALYLKVPEEEIALIVMANTEGVHWGNPISRAQVVSSPIAQKFLTLFASSSARD